MTKMLHNWLDPENNPTPEADAPAPKATNANKAGLEEAAPVAKVDDVASAFDSLFNN
jgi:hypothetical protein